ncbi:MAG: hypothetical protein QXT19_04235 [Candidatus Woesearchaeota archaeon]
MSEVGEDKYFEVPEKRRQDYIEKRIVRHAPRQKWADTRARASEVVASYQGATRMHSGYWHLPQSVTALTNTPQSSSSSAMKPFVAFTYSQEETVCLEQQSYPNSSSSVMMRCSQLKRSTDGAH